MSERDCAIADMKYAKSLGQTALDQHMRIWSVVDDTFPAQDVEYANVLKEIVVKLDTPECLLK